jgi:REP element-mobilizing transposase RayT
MKYDPNIHQRRSIRLKGYDYSQPGAYFVTMVARHRECLFGDIHDGKLDLTDIGNIIKTTWLRIPTHFPTTRLDEYIIMPNHFHGILRILKSECTGEAAADDKFTEFAYSIQKRDVLSLQFFPAAASPQPPKGTKAGSLNAIIQNFKSISTRKINQVLQTPGNKIWQRDYFERVIRNERELDAIRQYIQDNPLKWGTDQENPLVQA